MAIKDNVKKEFVCKRCMVFLDAKDLAEGKCPQCDSDEYVFINDLNEETK